ncbi:TPA: hypothetical protein ACX6QC_002694 [Photobacterium damselae]
MMHWLKIIICSVAVAVAVAVAGCGGDSAPNNDNSGGSEVTPPIISPSSKDIRAVDVIKKIDTNQNVELVNINLSNFVSSLFSEKITLEAVEPVSKNVLCQVLDVDEIMLQFSISPSNASGCIYKYTISNGFEFTSGYAHIIISAPASALQSDTKVITSQELPPFEYDMTLHELLNVNLVDDGIVDTSRMIHPIFSESVITHGNGYATLQENGQFDYKAISVGSTFISYYILDDMNTSSPDDDVVYQGKITISVSGSDNTPPDTKNATDLSPVAIGVGDNAEIDILAYPTDSGDISLVNDADSDELQLVFVNSKNIDTYIEADNLNNVKNTKFQIKGLSKGAYLVDYVVYDHNRDGIAHGQIPVNVTDTMSGEISFFLEGYIKLFKDGTLGIVPNSNSFDFSAIIKTANEQLAAKRLKATKVLSVGVGLFWVQTDNPIYSLIISTYQTRLFENIRAIYGNGINRNKSDTTNILYLLFDDNHVEVYSQAYFVGPIANTLPEAFNKLSLSDRQNIKRINHYSNDLVQFEYLDGSRRLLHYLHNSDGSLQAEWMDLNLDSNIIAFNACMLSSPFDSVVQSYVRNNADAAVLLKNDNSSCWYSTLASLEDNFKQLFTINTSDAIVNIDSVSLLSGPSVALTESNILYSARNYFQPWEKTAENVINFSVNSSSIVYRLKDGNIVIKSQTKCVEGMSIYPPTESSSSSCVSGADISPNTSILPADYGKNVKFYKVTSDVIGLLYDDGTLAFVSARGYEKMSGTYSWLTGDQNVRSGKNFDKAGWYQGSNLFIAYNLTTSKWDVFNPLEGWNGEFQCSFDSSLLEKENIIDIVIMSGKYPSNTGEQCPIYLFNNNGTQSNDKLNEFAYPKSKFIDSPFNLPIMDIDGDEISNVVELRQCKSSQSSIDKRHHYHWCSSPALADSDFDDVKDSFEFKYSSKDKLRYLSDSSHLMFEPISIAPKDAYKDINGNGLADWLEY